MPQPNQPTTDRREFLQAAGATLASLPVLTDAAAGAEEDAGVAAEPNHHVPAHKKLDPDWTQRLFAKGQQDVYKADRLKAIGMPVGGIAAGQLYVRGDGTLALWDIFNEIRFTGYGQNNYGTYTPPAPAGSGFALWVKGPDKKRRVRTLDSSSYPNVTFVGEYPMARVHYQDTSPDPVPVEVTLEAFSPFIPLNAKDSALPATVMRFTVTNTGNARVTAAVAGSLQNAVLKEQGGKLRAASVNKRFAADSVRGVELGVIETPAPLPLRPPGKPEVFEDFEDGTYKGWTATGTAFGDKPATGKIDWQQEVSDWQGKYFVNSFNPDDKPIGSLVSNEFGISRPYINFRIGGGNLKGKTCFELLIDGKAVRSAVGKNTERLEWRSWDVTELVGRRAKLRAVDQSGEAWGHLLLDDIQFADTPARGTVQAPHQLAGFGTMAISVLDKQATVLPEWDNLGDFLHIFRQDGRLNVQTPGKPYPLGLGWHGSVASRFELEPGTSKTVTFLVTWCFHNHPNGGRMYANWFDGAQAVAGYVGKHIDRLYGETKLWHDTYYDSTLPHWLLDRLHAPIANLATNTCQWWKNGRFWAYEGVGCCHGTCTHVWNYEHGLARLFPEMERSAREMQDLGVALQESGCVGFRGNKAYAADGQAGTILKCYREHLLSADDRFLKRNWKKIKKALSYSIEQDGNDDGLIENSQHNTFDINFEGANTFVGSLYLAALRAGEEMARLVGDNDFADRCRTIYAAGRDLTMKKLWNGEYFIHEVDLAKHPKHQYGTGCLSDQLFGQGWAHQVGLGYIYPCEAVRTALESVFKYNWAPDVGPQNMVHKPQRVFARPGEGGLFTCTWPKGNRPTTPVLYKNEIWTGIEYQAAGHMLWEGLVTQALTIIRAIHERYDGAKHNPWNEVECGDHYARALASWGCLVGLEGYVYDGPAGQVGFAPRLTPEEFKAPFTAAEGWGTLAQKRQADRQVQRIAVTWGKLAVRELHFALPENAKLAGATVTAAGRPADVQARQTDNRVTLRLADKVTIPAGAEISAELKLA